MSRTLVTRLGFAALALAILAFGLFAFTHGTGAADGNAGAVFTESNSATGNVVLSFPRAEDGTLGAPRSYSTGGLGSGVGLGSEGALQLTPNSRWLIAVNAGSNDISVLDRNSGQVLSRVSSGGVKPVSVTVHGRLVYAVNAGSDNISGFTLGGGGILSPIPNSTPPLSGSGVGPAQIQFSPDGQVLVVTEKNTNLIDTYSIGGNGVASGPTTHASSGPTPFGFDFGKHDTLVVSEAAHSAASSYQVSNDGAVTLVSGSVLNGQAAACWVVVTQNERYAYTADAHNGKISSYAIGDKGSLSLLNGIAGNPGGGPLDEAISRNDQFLYVLNPGTGNINTFGINDDGSLAWLINTGGIPASASGLVAR